MYHPVTQERTDPMRVDVQTNVTPIVAGDEVMIDFHPTWRDVGIFFYSVHLSFDDGRTFPRTLAPNVSVFDARYPWTVDVIGQTLRVRVKAHLALGLTRNTTSARFSAFPRQPHVLAPHPQERVSLAGPYTVRWEQAPPDPDEYRIFFAADGDRQNGQTLRDGLTTSWTSSRTP
jgi:hypothetical protein